MRDAQRRDQIFVALACGRRRVALSLLSDHQELTLPDLADEIAEREHRRSLTDIPPETVRELYLELYHQHVPRLESADLVTYSQDQDRVAVTDLGREVERQLLTPVESLLS
jgi:DNA-binding transcriptional ArsR family regulator